MSRKLYGLTDGVEIFDVKVMTYEQFCDARRDSRSATDGNINWELLNDHPVADYVEVCATNKEEAAATVA